MKNGSDIIWLVCWQRLARKQRVSQIIQNHEQVTYCTTGETGSIPLRVNFSVFYVFLTGCFAPSTTCSMGIRTLFLGAKRAGHEADRTPSGER
jgi:hypothetical protein